MRPNQPTAVNSHKRSRSEKMGRLAELIAAAFLMLKGYRILARRVRSPFGELDLIAARGRRLAFIEVKYRESLEVAEMSVTHAQADRMASAAEQWASSRPAYRNHHFGLDAVYIAPWRLPRHLIDGLQI